MSSRRSLPARLSSIRSLPARVPSIRSLPARLSSLRSFTSRVSARLSIPWSILPFAEDPFVLEEAIPEPPEPKPSDLEVSLGPKAWNNVWDPQEIEKDKVKEVFDWIYANHQISKEEKLYLPNGEHISLCDIFRTETLIVAMGKGDHPTVPLRESELFYFNIFNIMKIRHECALTSFEEAADMTPSEFALYYCQRHEELTATKPVECEKYEEAGTGLEDVSGPMRIIPEDEIDLGDVSEPQPLQPGTVLVRERKARFARPRKIKASGEDEEVIENWPITCLCHSELPFEDSSSSEEESEEEESDDDDDDDDGEVVINLRYIEWLLGKDYGDSTDEETGDEETSEEGTSSGAPVEERIRDARMSTDTEAGGDTYGDGEHSDHYQTDHEHTDDDGVSYEQQSDSEEPYYFYDDSCVEEESHSDAVDEEGSDQDEWYYSNEEGPYSGVDSDDEDSDKGPGDHSDDEHSKDGGQ